MRGFQEDILGAKLCCKGLQKKMQQVKHFLGSIKGLQYLPVYFFIPLNLNPLQSCTHGDNGPWSQSKSPRSGLASHDAEPTALQTRLEGRVQWMAALQTF